MIENIPLAKDYEKVGTDCIMQAFSLIYNAFGENDSIDNIHYHQRTLRNSVILVYQGLEILMKAEICKKSPLLIIDNKRRDWPTLPDSNSKDFNDFYTISGDDLIRTFFSIQEIFTEEDEKRKFIDFYNKIRKDRNVLMHGIYAQSLSPNNKIKLCLEALTFFFGKSNWISLLKKDVNLNPATKEMTAGADVYFLYKILIQIEKSLTKTDLNQFLLNKLKKNRSICNKCQDYLDVYSDNMKADWTYIQEGNSVCMICNE